METRIIYIGLLDKEGVPHGVRLEQGLNIITGRSSTGKSALIEIFDYCMGGKISTIPKGVITTRASVYFLIILVNKVQWVIGHDATSNSTFYLNQDSEINSEKDLSLDYFNTGISQNLTVFRRNLGHIFNLNIKNMQEEEDYEFVKTKKHRPSVRNMMSYILQHQNLIANKLAMFYRFDEKEKKDDVIEQFKIFAGFVDSQYYDLLQQISNCKAEEKSLAYEFEKEIKRKDSVEKKVENILAEYKEITDHDLLDITAPNYVLECAEIVKKQIQETPLEEMIVTQRKEDAQHVKNYETLQRRKNDLHAEIRKVQLKIQDLEDSIQYVEQYKNEIKQVKTVQRAKVDYSICPFCKQHTYIIEDEVKELTDSIQRINRDIREIPFLSDELYSDRTKAKKELDDLYEELDDVECQMDKIKDIIRELRKNRSLEEQGYKKMMEMESALDIIIEMKKEDIEQKLINKRAELSTLEKRLKSKYDIKQKMQTARASIEHNMAQFRKSLPFEKSLDDSALRFDLETFELYFDNNVEKTRMRSIGSGKNWLNAHLCLFLALSKYFYENPNSKLPTLLFIDQPSQVYFPTNDHQEEFDAAQLVENMEGKVADNDNEKKEEREKLVSDDMQEVTNIFNTLYKFTKDLNDGVQVIVTEHADKLKMDGVVFDDLVRERWRKSNEGLIMDRTRAAGNEDNKQE